MKKLVIVLLVLAALVVGADRIGVAVAQRVAADNLQTSQGLDERPEVEVAGFPFLTQLAAGRFDEIRVRAEDLPIGEDPTRLDLASLDVVLRDVEVSRDLATITAARARADGVIGFAALSDVVGIDLTYGGEGALTASRSFTIAGETFEPSVSVAPELVDGALRFGELSINGVNDSSGVIIAALDEVFGVSVPLQGIPFQVELNSLSVERDGLHLSLRGTDLTYVDR